MTAASNAIHVGLLWHSFRSENLGVGALTIANINLIAKAIEKAGRTPFFHILGVQGETDYSSETPYPNDFTNIGYKALATPGSALHQTMRRCHIFFDIGAGDSFSDIYGWKRYGLMIGSKFAAVRAGGDLVFSPQTIGPFASGRARYAAKRALNIAKLVYARDEPSFRVLGELGVADRAVLTTDVAFALPYAATDRTGRDLANGPLRVGLNVSALLYRRDIAAADKIALTVDYRALVDRIIERLQAHPRVELHLVPHVLATHTPYEDDYALAETLCQRHPNIVLPPRFHGPSQAKTYIAGLDFFLGSRMHATIAAISSGTAVLPLGYSRKFTGLFGSIDYPWMADLTAQTNDQVMERLEAALAEVPQLTADAVAAAGRAQQKLGSYTSVLDRLFAELAARHA
ncbi:polysaccharide pyruvyl transferase family protein [Flavisphingomonas formosensis]|uniref:polysaccharide pyruvyl transferase family protein n=1 Tax=Flavisphingomonas formosensis TaxID=861534 RepID=UPI001E58E22E|nr:polysaccharide pyruvyl transferase family protein [Sphingomonas formosensis]